MNKFGDTSLAEFKEMESLVHQTIWFGGSESHTFNKLESIAMSEYPQTPVLGKTFLNFRQVHRERK